jgi:thiol:disulfide interchange protein DsbD
LPFERIASVEQLDAALASAKSKGQGVMLDFYADWCVACKEYEAFTFSDAAVQKRLANTLLLQADVTANNAQDKALMKRFALFGPPAIVFFDGQSAVADISYKVVGYEKTADFLLSLDRGLGLGASKQ